MGKSVALRFLSGGYKVAVVSRSGAQSLDEEVAIQNGNLRQYKADFSRAEETAHVCKTIEDDFSSPISVFFYNGAVNHCAGIVSSCADTAPRLSLRRHRRWPKHLAAVAGHHAEDA